MGVILIKPIDVRAVFYRLSKINVLPVRLVPIPTQMPFADHGCVVSGFAHQMPECGTVSRNQVVAGATEYASGKA